MSSLRDHLTKELKRKVQKHGLVVWQDDAGEYRGVAAEAVPAGTGFAAWAGSAYELRPRVEEALSGPEPPQLVVYVDEVPPTLDPLAEIREAAGEFKLRLSTLLRRALAGELTEARIKEIAGRARTLGEAEAALSADGGQDVRVVSLLGTSDVTHMALMVLRRGRDDAIDAAHAWPDVAKALQAGIGGRLGGQGDELRGSVFRHVILTELANAATALPVDLATAWARPTPRQEKAALEVLRQLQIDPEFSDTYRELSECADAELGLGQALGWHPGFKSVVATEVVEDVVFEEATRRLDEGDAAGALELAKERLRVSFWARGAAAGSSSWGPRWRAVEAVGNLLAELESAKPPPSATTTGVLEWYVASGFRVDQAHRRMELARTGLNSFGSLDKAFTTARREYQEWLDGLVHRFSAALEGGALETGRELVRQGEVHDRFVAGAQGPVAYIWVDALRYELGADLAEALAAGGARAELHAAIAGAPTVTQVGMANLLPGAASSLRLGLDGEELSVTMEGRPVNVLPERASRLRARYPRLQDFELDRAAQLGDKALAKAIEGADLVLVRSGEVDVAGETDRLSVGWASFVATVNLLACVIARLLSLGVAKAVVTADHGFVALGDELGAAWMLDPPNGALGVLKRRVFVGRGGTTDSATLRVPLSATGVPGDLDLIVPRGIGLFRAGGARQFFHGGLSPQELVVPVIVVEAPGQAASPEPKATVSVAGGRITTGAFAAMVEFAGDLFTPRATVRVTVAGPSGGAVARVVAGGGFDPATGTVSVEQGKPSVLTFQVTENLSAGTRVNLLVLDARTGRTVTSTQVEVAAPVIVEEDLG